MLHQESKRILVTGASGFIGASVTRQLVTAGHDVRCLLRDQSRTDRIDDLPFERFAGDICDPGTVDCAASDSDAIVHLAGISAWTQISSPLVWPVIVQGTANVLRAAQKHAVSRMVYVSSIASLGPDREPVARDETMVFDRQIPSGMIYAAAKREAEQLCLTAAANGTNVVIVSPAEVYGPGDRDLVTAGNLLALLQGSTVFVCHGGTSVVHVEDVASGIVGALERGRSGERYFLGGENISHTELATMLLETAGRQARVLRLPGAIIRSAAAVAARLHLPFPVSPALVPYVTGYWFVNCGKAQAELGLEFRSARETLAATVSWLQEAGHLK